MSFLQPWLLAALPLVALPVIIHLINQRRYQTIRWAAMMFLLAANRMSRGYARLRQWLILAVRMLAIAGLTFAVSRPLAGGWLGLTAGGRPDTTIVVLDRSPSMQQAGAAGGSKRETGRRQLVQALQTLGSARWALIESATNRPAELESAEALLHAPSTEPVAASSDLPAMLQAAHDYVRSNKAGRTEIWICSDLRENDWNADSGRWQTLRDAFLELPQRVRFHLLAYPQRAAGNIAVRVTDVRRRPAGDAAELLISLRLTRGAGEDARQSVPIQFDIEGARSEVTVEMVGPQFELRDHRIALEKSHERGWGKVSIPADANPADNDFWFAFDQPAPRRTLIVTDDPQAAPPLQLAAGIAPDPALTCTTEVVSPAELGTVEWEKAALVLWQAPLPEGSRAAAVRAFIERGGQAIFFPPASPVAASSRACAGPTGSTTRRTPPSTTGAGTRICSPRPRAARPFPSANFESGATVDSPVIAHRSQRCAGARRCSFVRRPTRVASTSVLRPPPPAIRRSQRTASCSTSSFSAPWRPAPRRLEPRGRSWRASFRRARTPGPSKRLAGGIEAVSAEYVLQRGVYVSGDRLLAVNRAASEDTAGVAANARVAGLFRGLDFARVDDQADSLGAIIQEVWRLFLIAMMVALVAEAALCLPKLARRARATA